MMEKERKYETVQMVVGPVFNDGKSITAVQVRVTFTALLNAPFRLHRNWNPQNAIENSP